MGIGVGRGSARGTPRIAGLVTAGALLATACGGTYHPEAPDAASYIEVSSGAAAADPTAAAATAGASQDSGSTTGSTTTAGSGTVDATGTTPSAGTTTGSAGTTGSTTTSPETGSGTSPTAPTTDAAGFPVADIGADRPANASGSILLGIVGPHTGPIALQGLASLRGVQATIADYNARGGIDGVPIELLVEDDQFDPAQGRRYVQRMINEDQVFALMGLLTPATFAQSLPDLEASGTLQMIGDGAASTGGSRLVFPSYQKCPTAMGATTEYAIRDLGLTKLAILQIDIEISRVCADAIQTTADAMGAQVVYRTGVTPGGFGCASQAQGAVDAGAQTVLIQAETLTMIRCIQALQQQGFGGPIGLSANAIDDDALVDALKQDAEAIYSAAGFKPKTHPATRAQCTDIIDRYYPDSGATQYLGYASCIATRVLLDALLVLGPDATAQQIIGYLERGEPYDSQGMAPPMSWTPDDHEPYRQMFAVQIENGVWVVKTDPFEPIFGR